MASKSWNVWAEGKLMSAVQSKKGALRIIFPDRSYKPALLASKLDSLFFD